MSIDRQSVRNAENFVNGQVLPFPLATTTTFNPQAGLFGGIGANGRFHATISRKTRLPTIKDRYSYRLGQAIPNPGLREERALHYEAGYSHLIGTRTFLEGSAFASSISNSTQRFFLQPNLFQFRNLGEARHLGVEFSARSRCTARWMERLATRS